MLDIENNHTPVMAHFLQHPEAFYSSFLFLFSDEQHVIGFFFII